MAVYAKHRSNEIIEVSTDASYIIVYYMLSLIVEAYVIRSPAKAGLLLE